MKATQLHAGIRWAVWSSVEGIGWDQIGVRKVMAHATAGDVRQGRITAEDRRGNGLANVFAKKGAALPLFDRTVDQRAFRASEALRLAGCWVGRLGGLLWNSVPCDSAPSTRVQRRRGAAQERAARARVNGHQVVERPSGGFESTFCLE